MTAVEIKEELEKYIKEGRVTTKNKSLYNVVHSVLKPFTRTEKVIRYNKEGVPMYKLNESYKLNDFNE
jgi:dihydroneopterin aldolase